MYRVATWLLGFLLLLANPIFASSFQLLPKTSDDPTRYFTYRTERIAQLRASEKELKKGGGAAFIKETEAILEDCNIKLRASDDGSIFESGQQRRFDLLIQQIHAARPKWPTLVYEQEFDFYKREDRHRSSERVAAIALQARIDARVRRTTDSLQQIILARRRTLELDSLANLAKTQALEEANETLLAEQAHRDSVYFSHPGLVELDRRNSFRGLEFGSPLSSLSKQAKRTSTIDQDVAVYEVPGQTALQLGRANVSRVKYGYYKGRLIHVQMRLSEGADYDNMMALLKTAYNTPEMVRIEDSEQEEKTAQWKGRKVLLQVIPSGSGYTVAFFSIPLMNARQMIHFIKLNKAAGEL